jgi:hypothetical protein
MGAAESASPKTGTTRAEYVERVASSRVFRSSASLPRLLRYLAQRAEEEPGETIKEFRIATEALGRGAAFDSRTDSVVRVTTARLRSKLEEYYSTEGANDPLRLQVPKGSYRLLALPTDEVPGVPPVAASAPPRSLAVLPALFAIVAAAFAAGYFLGSASSAARAGPADPELARFWGAFANSPGGIRIVYSNSPHSITSYGRVLAQREPDPGAAPDDWHTGVGEVQAIHRLSGVADDFGLDLDLKRAQLVNWDEVIDVHVVYLGGPAANPQVADLGAQANFAFELEALGDGGQYVIRNRAPRSGEEAVYASAMPLTKDYGIVRLTRGFRSDRWILLLAGITTFGTSAAADVVSSSDSLRAIRGALGLELDDPIQPFECVVKVGVKNSVPFESRIKACRPLLDQEASSP